MRLNKASINRNSTHRLSVLDTLLNRNTSSPISTITRDDNNDIDYQSCCVSTQSNDDNNMNIIDEVMATPTDKCDTLNLILKRNYFTAPACLLRFVNNTSSIRMMDIMKRDSEVTVIDDDFVPILDVDLETNDELNHSKSLDCTNFDTCSIADTHRTSLTSNDTIVDDGCNDTLIDSTIMIDNDDDDIMNCDSRTDLSSSNTIKTNRRSLSIDNCTSSLLNITNTINSTSSSSSFGIKRQKVCIDIGTSPLNTNKDAMMVMHQNIEFNQNSTRINSFGPDTTTTSSISIDERNSNPSTEGPSYSSTTTDDQISISTRCSSLGLLDSSPPEDQSNIGPTTSLRPPLEVQPNSSSTRRSTVGLADSSPPEVTTLSSTRHGASSNYLPVNGKATPGDRGSGEGSKDVTSSGLPVADLWEAKGEVNRGAPCNGKDGPQVEADGRTTYGGASSGMEGGRKDVSMMDIDRVSPGCNKDAPVYCRSLLYRIRVPLSKRLKNVDDELIQATINTPQFNDNHINLSCVRLSTSRHLTDDESNYSSLRLSDLDDNNTSSPECNSVNYYKFIKKSRENLENINNNNTKHHLIINGKYYKPGKFISIGDNKRIKIPIQRTQNNIILESLIKEHFK